MVLKYTEYELDADIYSASGTY